MAKAFRTFLANDAGAITVDWVVISAVLVSLSVATVAAVRSGAVGLADTIATYVESQDQQFEE